MPEAGYLPIPGKLAQAGVKDMVRDLGRAHDGHGLRHDRAARRAGGRRRAARWPPSGTATGSGSRSRTSASTCWSSEAEIQRRLAGFPPPPAPARGYRALFRRTVLQAPQGCDFDFLTRDSSDG